MLCVKHVLVRGSGGIPPLPAPVSRNLEGDLWGRICWLSLSYSTVSGLRWVLQHPNYIIRTARLVQWV